MSKRVFLIVIDSFGIGEMPDASFYGDEGSNTLGAVARLPEFNCPNMTKLGLFNIDGCGGFCDSLPEKPRACYGRLSERSRGKDTTTGHWEIAGVISNQALPTYPDGFPNEVIEQFKALTGKGVLCNKPYSGTEVIRDYGEEHLRTGELIVYTSADSVFQIAAHERVVSLDELYRYCEIARKILVGKHGVGRVIARPFGGEYPFVRLSGRHDYSIECPEETMLDKLHSKRFDTISVGKINDIFAGRGVSESYPTKSNQEGMKIAKDFLNKDFCGICFVNLVDFDMLYGHRNDARGYASALSEFDSFLGEFLVEMKEEDLLIVTADHGCDPITPSTDHSREYVPLLLYGNCVNEGKNLGTVHGFDYISRLVLDYLKC